MTDLFEDNCEDLLQTLFKEFAPADSRGQTLDLCEQDLLSFLDSNQNHQDVLKQDKQDHSGQQFVCKSMEQISVQIMEQFPIDINEILADQSLEQVADKPVEKVADKPVEQVAWTIEPNMLVGVQYVAVAREPKTHIGVKKLGTSQKAVQQRNLDRDASQRIIPAYFSWANYNYLVAPSQDIAPDHLLDPFRVERRRKKVGKVARIETERFVTKVRTSLSQINNIHKRFICMVNSIASSNFEMNSPLIQKVKESFDKCIEKKKVLEQKNLTFVGLKALSASQDNTLMNYITEFARVETTLTKKFIVLFEIRRNNH